MNVSAPGITARGRTNPPAAALPTGPLFSLSELELRYDPFPIGRCLNVLEPILYGELLREWPARELFLFKPALGNKFSLSEVNHKEQYEQFIRGSHLWSAVHRLIKSPAFIPYVLEQLLARNIDIGYDPARLSARFEFSMLAGDGGHIKPHTDAPNKLVTLVINMVEPGEWQPAWGGGTALLKTKDASRNFNRVNIQLGFGEVESLGTYPFEPNACVVFVKTFNSLHAVQPIQGRSDVPRRSLTINIEDPQDPRLAHLGKTRPKFRR